MSRPPLPPLAISSPDLSASSNESFMVSSEDEHMTIKTLEKTFSSLHAFFKTFERALQFSQFDESGSREQRVVTQILGILQKIWTKRDPS